MRNIHIRLPLWQVVLGLLGMATVASFLPAFPWAAVTLAVFLLLPGYLLLQQWKHSITSRLTLLSLSLALSIAVLMVTGLALNSLHALGFDRPLDTVPLLLALNTVTGLLALRPRNQQVTVATPALGRPSKDQLIAGLALVVLPLLTIGGAIRLNNGASNVLTLVAFALVPVIVVALLARKSLRPLYPWAIFVIGVSLLLATSLRGSFIAGHDIQHEFLVFQDTVRDAHWSSTTAFGDPYNACLSITILPAIFAKLTAIADPYIFKVVFQVIFAASVLPLYILLKRVRGARLALLGSFVFMLFPTFLSDMPFLNRQEIAFVFFGALILVTFTELAARLKTALTVILLAGLILSHYSSSYVTIGLLLLAWLCYKLLTRRKQTLQRFSLPVLSLPIIGAALLFTFFWNAQVTASTGGLQQTIVQTAKGLWGGSETREGFVTYSLLAPAPKSPEQKLADRLASTTSDATYVAPELLPQTALGKAIAPVVDVKSFHALMHSFAAKVFQLLLIVGVGCMLYIHRKTTKQKDLYYTALAAACVGMLAAVTLLPQLSVDYSVIRLFQQTLIVTALPVIIGAGFVFGWLGRYKTVAMTALFIVLFGHLSGLTPQLLGGFRPQLSLNNAGAYYDFFYTHQNDRVATDWLAHNRDPKYRVFADTFSSAPPRSYPLYTGLLNEPNRINNDTGYLYQDHMNVTKQAYRLFLSGDLVEYRDTAPSTGRDLIYSNDATRIYDKRR